MDDFVPILCESKETKGQPLKRIYGGKKEEKKVFDETWLQELLRAHPNVLPVKEIDPAFAPLICIGREAEGIDNLYISPQGYLTLVETKLWRNPESRRGVVEQVICYAKALSNWGFKKLDECVHEYFKKYHNKECGLCEAVKEDYVDEDEFDEREFINSVNRNLEQGRMLLLIVGDGIREDVREMVEFIQQTPTLLFTLALVEIRCYSLHEGKDWPLIAVPRIVTRTREIERAVVRIKYEEKKPEVTVEKVETEIKSKPGPIDEDEFIRMLSDKQGNETADAIKQLKKHYKDKGMDIIWHTKSLSIKMMDPGESGVQIKLLGVDDSEVYTSMRFQEQLEEAGLNSGIAIDLQNAVKEKIPGSKINPRSTDKNIRKVKVPHKVLCQPKNFETFCALVDDTISRIEKSAEQKDIS